MTLVVDIFSTLATIALVALFLSPAPSIYAVHMNQATGVTPLLPLVSLFLNTWIMLFYGYFSDNIFPVVTCSCVGATLALIYTIIFYWWTDNRAYANRVIGGFLVLVAVATGYSFVGGNGYTNQSRESMKNVVGYVSVVTTVVFFSAPFENLDQVLKHRSGVFIPIQIVALGAINSVMWIIYSLLTTDWFIFGPNAGALVLASVQIGLYFRFHPSTHPYEEHTATVDISKDLEVSIMGGSAVGSPNASAAFLPLQSPFAPMQTRV